MGSRAHDAVLNLKPLKDLGQNFDIDVQTCLEEYLHELEKSGLVLSNESLPKEVQHAKSTNFVEAALLLQQSSSVYSRKVEYLYTLVYSTLHNILETTKASNTSALNNENGGDRQKRSSNGPKDIEEFHDFDADMEFLLLDDVLPTDGDGQRINIREEEEEEEQDEDNDLNPAVGSQDGRNYRRLSSIGRPSLTRYSISSKTDTSWCSDFDRSTRKSLSQMITSGATRAIVSSCFQEGSTLLLASGRNCRMGKDGVLMMPGTSLFQHVNPSVDDEEGNENGGGIDVSMMNDDFQVPLSQEINLAGQELDHSNTDGVGAHESMDIDGPDGDDHDEGIGFVLNEESGPVDTTTNTELNQDTMDNNLTNPQEENDADQVEAIRESNEEEAQQSLWKLLDPHDNKQRSRPLKVGVPYRLPEGIDEPPSKIVTGSTTNESQNKRAIKQMEMKKEEKPVVFSALKYFDAIVTASQAYNERVKEYLKQDRIIAADPTTMTPSSTNESSIDEDYFSDLYYDYSKPMSIIPPLSQKLAYGDEFLYLAEANAKKLAKQRYEQRMARKKAGITTTINDDQQKDSNGNKRSHEDITQGFDYGDDDDGGYDDDYEGEFPMGHDNANGTQEPMMNDENVNPSFDDIGDIASSSIDNLDAFPPDIDADTFESMCRQHLKMSANEGEKYAVKTHLMRRVSDWQDKLSDVLQEEEERPEYDHQVYSEKIVNHIKEEVDIDDSIDDLKDKDSKPIDYMVLTENEKPYEVSRLFVSSLMLCNTEHIQFSKGNSEVATPGDLQVELLNLNIDSPITEFISPDDSRERNSD